MNAALTFSESAMRAKLLEWGWDEVEEIEPEYYQNTAIEYYKVVFYKKEHVKLELQLAFSEELSQRLIKLV
jgi:hypothetical protein